MFELGTVGTDAAEVFRWSEFEDIAFGLGKRDDDRTYLFKQRDNFHVFEKNVHPTSLDLRQIENVVDQTQQVTA